MSYIFFILQSIEGKEIDIIKELQARIELVN